MDLANFVPILNYLYTDKMSISRYIESTNADGTTTTKLSQVPAHNDISCRISFSATDNPETNKEDTNPKYLQIKIFCGPDVDIQKGDKITAKRLAKGGKVLSTYTGTANLPLKYETHQEILLVQTGDA